MTNYVLIMAYCRSYRKAVLLRKKVGPEHLLGKLTSVGGKIEGSESPEQAAYREFEEETGLNLLKAGLRLTFEHKVTGLDYTLSVFSVDSPKVLVCNGFESQASDGESETIEIHHIDDLWDKSELVQDIEDFYAVRLGVLRSDACRLIAKRDLKVEGFEIRTLYGGVEVAVSATKLTGPGDTNLILELDKFLASDSLKDYALTRADTNTQTYPLSNKSISQTDMTFTRYAK